MSLEEETEDLEMIDPKEYPELYPETFDDLEEEQIDTEWFVEYNDEKKKFHGNVVH